MGFFSPPPAEDDDKREKAIDALQAAHGDAANADDWEAADDAVDGLIALGAVTRDDQGQYHVP